MNNEEKVLVTVRKPKGDQHIVFFSSETENTRRFVDKLGIKATRIPMDSEQEINVDFDYVLFCPTYSGGLGELKGSVPKQVIKFLNNETNRKHCVGIVASGNTNFGDTYGLAGDVLQAKLKVPLLHVYELLGTKADEIAVKDKMKKLWEMEG
ncbi:class Ib ribonucleoside-diphosphate reductase assembly flavoprotein NrdI [Mycoplasma corogypsi]|uniref:class Ib ribonucleoside-diphosphate reductase assembly flavoprotein NrdI n=1 Tax=Mycoplasma corogypsi TaxID=2106 RepID=UPI0038732DB4